MQIGVKAFYEIEQEIANQIVFSKHPYETYLAYVRAFHRIGISRQDWKNESIDALVDGWIRESPEIKPLLNLVPWSSDKERIAASYVAGIDYILRNGNWDRQWMEYAQYLEQKLDEDGN